MHNSTINVELELDVEVEYEIWNDGIGRNEYGSSVQFDRGQNITTINRVTVNNLVEIGGQYYLKLSPAMLGVINKEIENNTDNFLDEITAPDV